MIKIVDAFIFYNEINMLKFRLTELSESVDYFILVEATKTFKNNPKKLYYDLNKDKFSEYNNKIIHVIVDNMPENGNCWSREQVQRDAIRRGTDKLNLSDHDIILLSDADEIPDINTIRDFKKILINNIFNLEQDMYYYNLNNKFNYKWYFPKILPYYLYLRYTPTQIRGFYTINSIQKGGWHFSYFGDTNFIINKIKNFSHQEWNNSKYIDKNQIENLINNNKDLFFRGDDPIRIEIEDNNYLPNNYKLLDLEIFNEIKLEPEIKPEIKSEKLEFDPMRDLMSSEMDSYNEHFKNIIGSQINRIGFIYINNSELDIISNIINSTCIDLLDNIYILSPNKLELAHPKINQINKFDNIYDPIKLYARNNNSLILYIDTSQLYPIHKNLINYFLVDNFILCCNLIHKNFEITGIQNNNKLISWISHTNFISKLNQDQVEIKKNLNYYLLYNLTNITLKLKKSDYKSLKSKNILETEIKFGLPKNKYTVLFNNKTNFQAKYGNNNKFLEVQKIIQEKFIKNNLLIIPKGTKFNENFTDILPKTAKFLFLKINNNIYGLDENSTNAQDIIFWLD